ncbi:unnamed protein product [Linum trigynum]|uniref:Uncharacterized protein n=1 Tax=Linum trigynum TaxID=586398 RepID=A0AAV2FDD3_9ROSI
MSPPSLDNLPAVMAAVEATLTTTISQQFAELRSIIANLAQSTTTKYEALEQRVEALERHSTSVTTMLEPLSTTPAKPTVVMMT